MGIFYIKFALGALSRMHICMQIYILDVIKEMSVCNKMGRGGVGGSQIFPAVSSQILAAIKKTSTPTFCLNHPDDVNKKRCSVDNFIILLWRYKITPGTK